MNHTLIEPIPVHLVGPKGNQIYPVNFDSLSGPDQIDYVPRNAVEDIGDVFWLQGVTAPDDENKEPVLHLAHVGLTKSKDWAFEEEWRFRLPFCMNMTVLNGSPEHVTHMPLPREDHVLVPFNPAVLSEMDVMTGPKFTPGQRGVLEGLIAQHAPLANISESGIRIR